MSITERRLDLFLKVEELGRAFNVFISPPDPLAEPQEFIYISPAHFDRYRFHRFLDAVQRELGDDFNIVWSHDDLPEGHQFKGKEIIYAVPVESAEKLCPRMDEILDDLLEDEYECLLAQNHDP
jgi:hypothetical protein